MSGTERRETIEEEEERFKGVLKLIKGWREWIIWALENVGASAFSYLKRREREREDNQRRFWRGFRQQASNNVSLESI